MQTETVNVPTSFDFDDTDNEKASAYSRLREGLFHTAVIEAARYVNEKTGNLQIGLVLAPLDANGNKHSPTARFYIDMPKKPDGTLAEDIEKVMKRLGKFVNAIDPGSVTVEKVTKDETSGVWTKEDGSVMARADWDLRKRSFNKQVGTKALEWYSNLDKLKNATFYTFMSDGGEFSNVYWVSADPGDKEVITSNFAA